MEIREVEVRDAFKLIEHSDLVAKETYFLAREVGELNVTIEKEESIIKAWRESSLTNFLVCVIDEEIVGSCIVSGRTGRKRLAHLVSLGISVNKAHWGKGIASKMIEKQIQFCKENKVKKINLQVMTDNTKAIELYKKFGFEIEGTERCAIFVNDEYVDNYYMGLIL